MQANLKPGDEVVVKAGTYHESVRISKSGNANDYITVRAEKPGAVKIVPPSDKDFGVHIQGDYVKLDGFEITGARSAGITAHLVHHVEITNNHSHHNGGHGISASRSEFVTVEGNVTNGNASKGYYSGISIVHPENITNDHSSKGFRIVVRGNISFDNVTKSGPHTDGNGIIMDDFRSTKTAAGKAYLFASLVENNLVYKNGGKGIQVAWSDYVTVRNNTAWSNNVDPQHKGTWHGELSNMNSSHNTWVNNLAFANPNISGHNTAIDNTSFKTYSNKDVVWKNNLTYAGKAGDASVRTTGGNQKLSAADGNLLGVDPKFVSAPNNFELQKGSPAIDSGTKAFGYFSSGLDSGTRVGAIDIGAYEWGSKSSGGGGSVVDDTPATPGGDGTSGSNVLNGTGKANTIQGTAAHEEIHGLGGNDILSGGGGNDTLFGDGGADKLNGNSGADVLNGGSGADVLKGGEGNDRLFGDDGADVLNGDTGSDMLRGGTGKDVLVGGSGADTFVFATAAEAGKGRAFDTIRDFSRAQGDKIDLSDIDAVSNKAGNQSFDYIGSKGFSGDAGELRYSKNHVYGDLNGDRVADFDIHIANGHALHAGDFLL
jgi:serralysin